MSQPLDSTNEMRDVAHLPAESLATDAHLADEKTGSSEHVEHTGKVPERILTYSDEEHEPELHARTFIAMAALLLLNYVQVVSLQGPPTILTFIGADVGAPTKTAWLVSALNLVQTVVGPLIAAASDTYQSRKLLLVVPCTIAFIGSAIAPGATNIYRVIAAQVLIGFGFATVPLAYAIPSEIVPRRWRPLAQGSVNLAACAASITAPLISGGLTRGSSHRGWRNFFWVQMALWGATVIGIAVGYRPPKRHSKYDHLTFTQKLAKLDLPGLGLLTTGLTLVLVGLGFGDNPYPWKDAHVLGPLIVGIVLLIVFGLYEWKGTSTGFLHHDLFKQGRGFAICVLLLFLEGTSAVVLAVFYPAMSSMLFTTDPLLIGVRNIPAWVAMALATIVYAVWSSKARSLRIQLAVGFTIFTSGIVGLATIQPGQSTHALAFMGLAGVGLGAPLILLVTGVQLFTPPHLIAVATSVVTSSRALAVTAFVAIFSAVLTSNTTKKIPAYIAEDAVKAGLPVESLPAFIGAIATSDIAALPTIPGVTPEIIQAGVAAVLQALADSLRTIFIIASCLGATGALICFFVPSVKDKMHYKVDAPLEDLHARKHHDNKVLA